ncbi:MAG: STAS-like domain-containing protein [Myxococcota bacterium]|nr:STAS-like domain-containing protein [Myxococcota bacterium]
MVALPLPQGCTHQKLAAAIHVAQHEETETKRFSLQVPRGAFIHSSALALLAAWGLRQRDRGVTFRAVGDKDTLRYLARMDLFEHLEIPFKETFRRHPETGRFIALKLVQGDGSGVKEAVDAICELILRQFDNAREFLPAVEWAANEVTDNIRIHAAAKTPGVVCAQYYPQKARIDIGICDMGRGIKESLSTRFDLWSHGDAVTKALKAGVTRDPDVGQGNGLAGSLEIIQANKGEFHLWTGDVDYACDRGKEKGFTKLPEIGATGVMLRFRTANPVDLFRTTIVGERDWTYLDEQAERVSEAGGIDIAAECEHTRGRLPAKALRRRVEALLESMEEPLVLDFQGVRTPSSSFLDELVARLVVKLGRARAKELLQLTNMSDLVRGMTSKVVEQRLGDEDL